MIVRATPCIALLALAALVAASATPLRAQAPAWHYLTNSPPLGARTGVAMVHDAAHQRIVLFGGNGPPGLLGDTWLWDGAAWTVAPVPLNPSARSEHAMAYDAARQRVVMFGGSTTSAALGDLWEWDGAGWTQVTASPAPSARAGHAMAYDAARQCVVLFGGGDAGSFFDDTWEWNGASWTLRTPAVVPPPRAQQAMSYDPVRQRVVMCGGHFGSTVRADVWEWDGTSWSPAGVLPTPAGTQPGRFSHAMCWHPPSQQVLLNGGIAYSGGASFTDLGDTWSWNGASWTTYPTYGPIGFDHTMAFDPIANGVLLFGGRRLQWWPSLALLYLYGGWQAAASPYGTGCGTPPMTLASPAPSALPILGNTARAAVSNAPTMFVAIAFGSTDQGSPSLPLPLSLSSLGMTGCWLWHAADIVSLTAAPVAGGHEVGIAVPVSAGLLGSHLFLQAWGYAPGQNPADVTTSNGLDWCFGIW